MRNFLRSLRKSLAEAVGNNEYVVRWGEKHPRFFSVLGKRLSWEQPYGLAFGLGALVSAYALLWFVTIAENVSRNSGLAQADASLLNLFVALRTLPSSLTLLFFTDVGSGTVIAGLSLGLVLWWWLKRDWRKMEFLFLALLSGEILLNVFKFFIHRARPELGFALIPRSGYAFPSGHATMAVIFYGLLGYWLWRRAKPVWLKVLTALGAFGVIMAVGVSRAYLGVHWTSDVLGGWLLGLSVLALLITFYHQAERFQPRYRSPLIPSRTALRVIFIGLVVMEAWVVAYDFSRHPLQPARLPAVTAPVAITSDSNLVPTILSSQFPKFSETLSGQRMEPISLIVVGTEDQLRHVFQAAGWQAADEPTPGTWDDLAVAALFNLSYPTAPVTPAFLNAQPNTLAFEKATTTNTVRQRHHTRFWLTNFSLRGVPLWVATSSFDDGTRYLITHKIHPDIDTERDFIMQELSQTKLVLKNQLIQLVHPLLGQNQGQDTFFTDGKAYIVWLQ